MAASTPAFNEFTGSGRQQLRHNHSTSSDEAEQTAAEGEGAKPAKTLGGQTNAPQIPPSALPANSARTLGYPVLYLWSSPANDYTLPKTPAERTAYVRRLVSAFDNPAGVFNGRLHVDARELVDNILYRPEIETICENTLVGTPIDYRKLLTMTGCD